MATLAGRNLPAKARALGLNVIELQGWETNFETDGPFDARGVLLHHDAMALGYVNADLSDNLNVPKNMARSGNGSQVWIGRDLQNRMALVFMASGRKWHAGSGSGFRSIPAEQGNSLTIGIETDHTTGTGWDDEMMHYIDVTTILFCDEFGIDPDRWLAGHREYAPGRKPDPESYDLNAWRARVKGRAPWGGGLATRRRSPSDWLRLLAAVARSA